MYIARPGALRHQPTRVHVTVTIVREG